MTDNSVPAQRVTPKDAASLILLDYKGNSPLILLGKRHQGHKFMPGKFVFPGGRVDPSDRQTNVCGTLESHVESRLCDKVLRPSPLKARALALAAIRETFEETGLMIGEKDLGPYQAPPATPWESFEKSEVWPSLEGLEFVARAVTPPGHSKRFDTRFFLTDATRIAHRIEGVAGPESELTELVWVPLQEAKNLDIPRITGMILDEIQLRLDGGLKPYQPVPYFLQVGNTYRRELIA
jgi:8-oxo-dGTP pyrophosphatase MutT (NUDIX family)